MTVTVATRTNGHVADVLATRSGIQLDIGCGAHPQPGFVGMDIRPLPEVDIVHDIESYPWPLPDNSVVRAMASHLVEHIHPARFGFIRFMDEVWRVLQPGAQFLIATPHGRSEGYLQDPTHCNPCNEITWFYFDPLDPHNDGGLWSIYQPRPWRIQHLTWDPSANIEVVLAKRSYDELAERWPDARPDSALHDN